MPLFGRPKTTESGEAVAAGPASSLVRRELLGPFALVVVFVLLAGMAVTSLVGAHMVRYQIGRHVRDSAPVLMNLITDALQHQLPRDRAHLRKLVDELGRLPSVQRVRVELVGDPGGGPSVFESGPAQPPHDVDARELVSNLEAPDGTPLARLVVRYGQPAYLSATGMLWPVAGGGVVLMLLALVAFYRAAARRVRPFTHIRDNLLAYQRGAEPTLDMLALQDEASAIAGAWNTLIEGVRDLRLELDRYRCREVLHDSLEVVNSHHSHAILDALPVGLLRIDPEDSIVYANRAANRLLQMKSEEEGQNTVATRLKNKNVAEMLLSLRHHVGGTGMDCRLEHGTGHTIVRLSPLTPGSAGDDLVVMIQDVTQLKEAERSRDDFLAHITHELRTPLTNIRAYTETLNEDFFDDEQTRRECYNVIMGETRRLAKLIEDVLSVSQIEAGGARLAKAAVRVDQVLRQVFQDVQAAADAKSIDLSLKIPSKVPQVAGDRFRLHQVWVNLIGNAIKYTPAKGSVSVLVEVEEKLLRVRIADTGIGIAPQDQSKVFEKFYRVADPVVEAEEGTGLGLAITRDIVRMHGGTIRLESEHGAGSTFIVELPVAGERQTQMQA